MLEASVFVLGEYELYEMATPPEGAFPPPPAFSRSVTVDSRLSGTSYVDSDYSYEDGSDDEAVAPHEWPRSA